MYIREASPEDMERILELFSLVYQETFQGEVPDFKEVTVGEKIFAAVMDDDIVGMATVWEPDAFIHYLFVRCDARRRKVGMAIVESLAGIYDRSLTLKCLLSNQNAVAFYRASGWEEIERGNSEDGQYMLLRYPLTDMKG